MTLLHLACPMKHLLLFFNSSVYFHVWQESKKAMSQSLSQSQVCNAGRLSQSQVCNKGRTRVFACRQKEAVLLEGMLLSGQEAGCVLGWLRHAGPVAGPCQAAHVLCAGQGNNERTLSLLLHLQRHQCSVTRQCHACTAQHCTTPHRHTTPFTPLCLW